MPHYIDGFVIPIPTKNLAAYRRVARKAGQIWKDHGALDYWECAGDDLEVKGFRSFRGLAKARPDETVLFSWAVFKSRAHRDRANAAIMKDPRIAKLCGQAQATFDCRRMAYGGFKALVRV